MTRDLAEKLLPWVNDAGFREAVEAYANARLDARMRELEQHADMLAIARAQGAVHELRRIFTLRDEVLAYGKS